MFPVPPPRPFDEALGANVRRRVRAVVRWVPLTWWRFRETRDQAWTDGYKQSEADGQEYLEGKEAWIAQCESAIQVLLDDVLTEDQWAQLKEEEPALYDFLGGWA